MLTSALLLPPSVTSMQTAGITLALIAVLANQDSLVMAKIAQVRIEQRLFNIGVKMKLLAPLIEIILIRR